MPGGIAVPSPNLPSFENIPASIILREMFDRADIGMALTDIGTRRFLRVNAKLCEITGYSERELLNTTAIALTHPEDRTADAESFEAYVRKETDLRVIEKRHIRRNGTIIWVHTTTTIVQLGDVRCSFGITEDVTERKAAAAALEAAERRKNYFIATLAHELRNRSRPSATARCCCGSCLKPTRRSSGFTTSSIGSRRTSSTL